MSPEYFEALGIVRTEAEMMAKGNRSIDTSLRWLREAVSILENEQKGKEDLK
jgi:hypothetical protein